MSHRFVHRLFNTESMSDIRERFLSSYVFLVLPQYMTVCIVYDFQNDSGPVLFMEGKHFLRSTLRCTNKHFESLGRLGLSFHSL